MSRIARYYDSIADTYHRQYEIDQLDQLGKYPANFFRLQILTRRLAGLKSVFEIGLGEGTPLATIASMGIRVAGCDISKKMVERAVQNFQKRELSYDAITWADFEDSSTVASLVSHGPYDAVIASGVLPHINNDRLFFQNMKMMLDRGKILIEFRNKLFSLFTFNRLTKEFILEDLLRDVDKGIRSVVADDLDQRLDLTKPERRPAEDLSYDDILAKFHNPFDLIELVEDVGFTKPQFHWYHYHPGPPMLAPQISDFQDAAKGLEHEQTWRGMFLCSAGILEATVA